MRAVDVSGAPCVRDASHQDVRVVDVVVVLDEVGDRVVARRRHRAVEVDGCEGGALAASDPEVVVLHAEERDARARHSQRAELEQQHLEVARRLPHPPRARREVIELDRDGRFVEYDGGEHHREAGVLLEVVPVDGEFGV